MNCLLAVYWNGSSSHLSGHDQFYKHQGSIFIPLRTSLLEATGEIGLYDAIWFDGYDLVLWLLALRRSQEVTW